MDHSYIPKEILDQIVWKQDKKQPGDPDQIRKIKSPLGDCEDCGQTLQEPRTVRICISRNQTLQSHIKHHCQYCKRYKNPLTGEWDCSFHDVNNHFKWNKTTK